VAYILQPRTCGLLDELAAAGTQQAALTVLQEILKLAADRTYWGDFEELLTSSLSDHPRYSRRLLWDLKTHLVEGLHPWASSELGIRLYSALTDCIDRGVSPDTRRETRRFLVNRWCSNGMASSVDFARRVLEDGDDTLRSAVLDGVVTAQFGRRPVDLEFAEWAVDLLAAELPHGSAVERERWLATIRVLSPLRWQELRAWAPQAPAPVWDAEAYRAHGSAGNWGDYGHVLFHGMAHFGDDREPLVQLERTGPFVPPVTVPSRLAIVVTDAVRAELATAGFERLTFRQVDVRKLTLVNWHEWDRSYPHPAVWPAGGEPENYVMARKDRTALHGKIGALWQLVDHAPGLPESGARDRATVVSVALARYLFERHGEWLGFEPIHSLGSDLA
jgi:hypothetical protein